ncbi:hypothetical protein BRC71_10830 [Halobacteriales archaeon QH_7_65_31]|nr:MAG: hypothetical protein BRC71_10830 [Halobacteriales archaeon QH_7_65_31]
MSPKTVVCFDSDTATPVPDTSADTEIERVTAVAEIDSLDPDCIVYQIEDSWESTIATMQDAWSDVPIILTGSADPRVGAVASRLGVEYAPDAAFDGTDESLWSRVEAAIETDESDETRVPLSERIDADPWFEAIFEQSTAFVSLLDPDGTLVRANEVALAGVDDEAELVGRPFWELPWWDIGDSIRDRVRDAVARANRRETVSFQSQYCRDGQIRELETVFRPIVEDETVIGIIAAGHDVTGHQRNQNALRDLHEAAAADVEIEEKLSRLLGVGCEYLDLGVGFATVLDEETEGGLQVYAAAGDGAPAVGNDISIADSHCGETLEADGVVTLEETARYGPGLRSYVGGTVVVDGEPFGTLCFAGEEPRSKPFDETEHEFVELLLRWASYELERKETQRKRAEANETVERVLDRIDDGFFGLDSDWEFTYLNEQGHEIIQAAAREEIGDDIAGEQIWELIPDALGTAFERNYRAAMQTQSSVSFEEYYAPLDTWFEVRVHPSEGGLSVFFQDVTERKIYQEGLNGLLSTTEELMAANDQETVAATVRDAAETVLGLSYSAVRLYDEERDVLRPIAMSDAVVEEMSERPVYGPGESLVGTAFERGEPIADHEYEGDEPPRYGPVERALVLPLGDHGTLSIGTDDEAGISGTDQTLASVLAANAAAALAKAERETQLRQYRAIHENISQLVYVIDNQGYLREITDPLVDWLGYDREEMIGEFVGSYLSADALASGQEYLQTLYEKESDGSRTIETTLVTAEGEDLPVDIEVSLLQTESGIEGSIGVVRDRSELEAERSRFSSLFGRAPGAVVDAVLTDEGPIVRRVNPAFAETFGVDVDTAAGQQLDELIADDGSSETTHLDEFVGESVDDPIEVKREATDGQRTFLLQAVRYGVSEDGPLVFGIYTDITERRTNERRIRMLNRVFRHNLANTGGIIQGHLKMLADELDGDQRRYVDSALEAANRIETIAEKIRSIERALSRESADSGDLADVVGRVVDDTRADHPEATFETAVPSMTVPDAELLETAVGELVRNAAIHGGDTPRIQVTGRAVDATVQLRVSDDGPKIPERERAVVSGEIEITQLDHSRGLGLWLVYYVSESLDGTMRFEDDGRTVVLELPRVDDGAP